MSPPLYETRSNEQYGVSSWCHLFWRLKAKRCVKMAKTTPNDRILTAIWCQSRPETASEPRSHQEAGHESCPAWLDSSSGLRRTQNTKESMKFWAQTQRSALDAPSSKSCDKSQRKHQWLRAAVMRQAEAFPDFLWRWKHCVFEFWSNDHKKGWDEFSDAQDQRQTKWKWVRLRFLRKQFGIKANVSTQGQDRKSVQLKYADTHTRN